MELISLVIRAFNRIRKRISLLTLTKRRHSTKSKIRGVTVAKKGKQPECVKKVFDYFENGNVSEDEQLGLNVL